MATCMYDGNEIFVTRLTQYISIHDMLKSANILIYCIYHNDAPTEVEWQTSWMRLFLLV